MGRETNKTPGAHGGGESPERRPNVLFVITDDQRFDTIAALGNPDIETPNLDYLCDRGVAFRNAYITGGTSGAVCMPSRAVYHTGRGPFSIVDAGEVIPPEHTTIGEQLRAHGYETFGTGKWHSDPDSFLRSFAGGAEIFFGGMDNHWNMPVCDYPDDGRSFPEPAEHRWNPGTGGRETAMQRYDHLRRGVHSSELFAGAAIDFLNGWSGERPFFLYAAFTAPHDPRSAPQEFHARYKPEELHISGPVLPDHPFDNGELEIRDEKLVSHPYTPEKAQRERADYYAMITHFDYWLGRVIDALKGADALENTIIIHTADHGLALGNHGLMGKQNLYEHSIHVPLLVSGPGVPAGEERETMVSSPDLFPTVCDLVGVPVPGSVEGRSFAATLADANTPHREEVFAAYKHLHRAIRRGRHKLIEYAVGDERITQLFDLQLDPHETVNLAFDPAYERVLVELTEALAAARKSWNDPEESFDSPGHAR